MSGTHSHDHELLIGSTTYRLNLVRDDKNKALYSVTEDVPEYSPQLQFEQTNWINGHGNYWFDDPNSFFEGQSIDTTQEGRIILGPKIFEVYEDDDTELDSAPVKFAWFAGASTPIWLCATAGKIYRYIEDDTGIDTDEALDATETGVDCDADASTPIPAGSVVYIGNEQMYVSATGTTLTVVRGYHGTTAATHTTNADIYIYKWKAATTTVANVTDLKEFKGIMYAAVGASTKYYYSTDGDTWTQTDLSDGYANKFLSSYNADGTAVTLWKYKTPNEISSTTDGRTIAGGGSEWSSAAYIGDTSADITNMFLLGDNFMIGREDNLFNYDSAGGIHPLMDELKLAQSSRNFKYVTNWQGLSYVSRGDRLGELSGGTNVIFNPVGPFERTIDIGKAGFCTGLTSDPNYLYIAMDEGTNIHIYKSREVRTDKGLVWQYCSWVYLGTNACTTIEVCQHSATDRRLWFGYGTHTGYVIITDNPTSNSDARFATAGWLRMSYTFGHNLYWDKLFNRLITDTKGCSATETISPYYRKDTDTTATSLTAAITTNGVVETDFTSLISCKKIQFQVNLASADDTTTPEVLMFRAMGVEKPEAIRVHECVYAIGDQPSNRAETLRTAIRTARTSLTLVRFADLRFGENVLGTAGTDFAYVVCQPGYPKEIEVEHEKGRAPELGIQVRWQEVGNTIVDANLIPGYIKSGVTLLGTLGTFSNTDTPATASDILSGLVAFANGSTITGTMPTQTLSVSNDTVSAGYYAATTLSAVDTDLASANIKSGTTIFGKAGAATVQDIADADLTVSEAPTGKKFYAVTGSVKTGTGTKTLSVDNDTVAAGYYAATTLSAVDTDLAVGNIKNGVTIFGKLGTYTPYTITEAIAASHSEPTLTGSYVTKFSATIPASAQKVIAWANFHVGGGGGTVSTQIYYNGVQLAVATGGTTTITYQCQASAAGAGSATDLLIQAKDSDAGTTEGFISGGAWYIE